MTLTDPQLPLTVRLMPSFDFVAVGAGGGPDETNLSAYLFKPHDAGWHDGVLGLEAGSAQGALATLLHREPRLFNSLDDSSTKSYTAPEIYSFLRCFLITHAHLDHISGLVMSAGSFKGPRKRIYATKETLNDLENVFSDRIWPNLASWDENDDDYKLLYSQLHVDNKYKEIYPGISVQTMPLNHGHNERGHYASTAFFIRHDIQNREFLFFGDVEPDVVAAEPLNINVWRAAAPKVPHKLSAIFIECSWPSGRSDDTLYGHMNPTHLVTELVALATEVIRFKKDQSLGISTRPAKKKQKRNPITDEELVGALQRLRIYVIHCKDDLTGDPAREIIVSQIRDLVEVKKLGAEIIAVEQGMYIEI